jgi:hypothetical protein
LIRLLRFAGVLLGVQVQQLEARLAHPARLVLFEDERKLLSGTFVADHLKQGADIVK